MNEENVLVLLKGEDKTKDVESFAITNNEAKIKFYNKDAIYPYSSENVNICKKALSIDLNGKDIYYKNQILFNIQKAIGFEEFIKIFYKNGETEIFKYSNISIKTETANNLNKSVIDYFREISRYVKNNEDEAEGSFLKREYEKLKYINSESILNFYINKLDLTPPNEKARNIIYPFRFNKSQKEAIENVYKSKISIIEGPPGTGKTQTILNIIANLAVMENKTIAVVSNNNEAVKNIKDKLEKSGYGFIVAN